MKGIKGLKITKTAVALFLAGSMSVSLSSCVGYVNMGSISPSDLLAKPEVENVTMIDEMIDDGKLQYTDGLNIVEAADQLERYMNIVDALEKENFDGVEELQPLSEDQYKAALSFTLDDIEQLRVQARYKGNDLVDLEKKLYSIKVLNYLKNYCNEWVHENGQDISIKFMMASVKGAVGSELGLNTDDYSSISISSRMSSSEPESNFIKVGNDGYEVKLGSEELWNTINYIYAVQDYDPANGNEFETYRKAINNGKITMAAGANVKNNRLEEQYSASYIKKNYVK